MCRPDPHILFLAAVCCGPNGSVTARCHTIESCHARIVNLGFSRGCGWCGYQLRMEPSDQGGCGCLTVPSAVKGPPCGCRLSTRPAGSNSPVAALGWSGMPARRCWVSWPTGSSTSAGVESDTTSGDTSRRSRMRGPAGHQRTFRPPAGGWRFQPAGRRDGRWPQCHSTPPGESLMVCRSARSRTGAQSSRDRSSPYPSARPALGLTRQRLVIVAWLLVALVGLAAGGKGISALSRQSAS
jgi:hypothetical protein